MALIKKTNYTQFERLVELMKKDVDLARGISGLASNRQDIKRKWNEIASELNNLGPPTRDAYEWKKVWIDTKARVKRILAEINEESNGAHARYNKIRQLNPWHQEVIALLSIDGNTPGSSVESEEESTNDMKPIPEILDQLINGTVPLIDPFETVTVIQDPIQPNQPSHQPDRKSKTSDNRFALLKRQTTIQEATLSRLTKIEENTCEIAKSLNKLVNVQEKRNELFEAELKLKRRKLELKEKELDRSKLDVAK